MFYFNCDLESLEKDLLEDSSRLFVDDQETYIQVTEASGSRKSFSCPLAYHTDR